jgi:hypothetical protein
MFLLLIFLEFFTIILNLCNRGNQLSKIAIIEGSYIFVTCICP